MKKELLIPLSIVIASLVLGLSFFAVQVHKANSIEKQQLFSNETKCRDLTEKLRKNWTNVVAVFYKEQEHNCFVRSINEGYYEDYPIEDLYLHPLERAPIY